MSQLIHWMTEGDFWTALGGVSLMGFAVLMIRQWIRPVPRRMGRVCAVLCLGMAAGVIGTVSMAPRPDDAVVIRNGVVMRVSPFEEADIVGEMTAGERIRVEQQHGEYAFVECRGGLRGWLPSRDYKPYF